MSQQAEHQPMVKNIVATEHAPGLAVAERLKQVGDMSRKILLFRHKV
jgi:hypothetical protein